jgi:hypothetical protein
MVTNPPVWAGKNMAAGMGFNPQTRNMEKI